jgi:hypothetical protein
MAFALLLHVNSKLISFSRCFWTRVYGMQCFQQLT